MNIVAPTTNKRFALVKARAAFTLIEMLVVIAIIGILASLGVVGLKSASAKKRITRTTVELNRLVTWIEGYKEKIGTYPRDNRAQPGNNLLYYELAGTTNLGKNPNTFFTFLGAPPLDSGKLSTEFQVSSLVNSSPDRSDVKTFIQDLKPDATFTNSVGIVLLTAPVEGPNGRENPWYYLAPGTNNPSGFDLWADIIVNGKTKRIGNWKE